MLCDPPHDRLALHLAADCPRASVDVLEAVLACHPPALAARAAGPNEGTAHGDHHHHTATGLKTARAFAEAAGAPAAAAAFLDPKTGGTRAGQSAEDAAAAKKKGGCVVQ